MENKMCRVRRNGTLISQERSVDSGLLTLPMGQMPGLGKPEGASKGDRWVDLLIDLCGEMGKSSILPPPPRFRWTSR